MASVHFLFDPNNDWLSPYISPHLGGLNFGHSLSSGINVDDAVGFDVLFILGYTKIISAEILAKNALNLVVHESALPEGRGFSPVQWQVLNQATTIPVCLIEATPDADSGDIFNTTTMHLDGHELWSEIRRLQAAATLHLIGQFLAKYPSFRRIPQTGMPSIYRRRRLEDDALDIDKTIRQQFNHFRIADNERFPLYFEIGGHRYTLQIKKTRSLGNAPIDIDLGSHTV